MECRERKRDREKAVSNHCQKATSLPDNFRNTFYRMLLGPNPTRQTLALASLKTKNTLIRIIGLTDRPLTMKLMDLPKHNTRQGSDANMLVVE